MDVKDVKRPDKDAQLVAENIATAVRKPCIISEEL